MAHVTWIVFKQHHLRDSVFGKAARSPLDDKLYWALLEVMEKISREA